MPTTAIDRTTLLGQAAKKARWEAQRRVSKLEIAPVRVGILGWAANFMLRRPSEFPTFEFARFRAEIIRQSKRKPLDAADVAVVKFRARLLGSAIDARFSKPLTGTDVDAVADTVIAETEAEHAVQLCEEEVTEIRDACWQTYADHFGSLASARATQLEAADGFVPAGGPELAKRLREMEAEAVVFVRDYPRQR